MLILDKDSKISLYMQIYSHYQNLIVSGEIAEGMMLPSIRDLSKNMNVSRNTVEAAYQQLYSEGYISSKVGSGYLVEKFETNLYEHFKELKTEKEVKQFHEQGISTIKKYNFQYGRLNVSDFPLSIWRKLLNQTLLSDEIDCLTAYNNRTGELELRTEIQKYLHESRGVNCEPDQIILRPATLACISLICQLLMKNTNTLAIEEPTYDSARDVFRNHGFNMILTPVQEDGLNIDFLKKSEAKAVFITPSHQFPTGAVMPINKRLSLIEWAEQNDSYIIEDDYDSELRYNSRPIPCIQSLDTTGRVIYINSFSKAFAPGLRMGFVVLPPPLLEIYQTYFSRYNCAVPWLEQKAMYEFMNQGYWSRHLRKVTNKNKRKHDILIRTIAEVMGERIKIHGRNAGLHILLEIFNGMKEKELIEKAAEVGVKVYPVSIYWGNKEDYSYNMVLMGFSGLTETEIIEGIHLLNAAWF
ncbi:PLP-dependent aminotransferase family protein [Clostridium aminobutyricum]|uniref:PLP-dependent aminotransferase family protein n=1 Tax=Clostridium aminobutyricum TaxID=33953 RepID=A0A939IJE3_CLOAM|nr:PLP-dependent aminotransferase family protein [Clostridium aminobutyricum]MBN7773489.1 PLP-dependent aminotransferase family protein [Clostridium aminobutyricum]